MSNVYVEFKTKEGQFVATQSGREIGRGDTQEEAIDQARRRRQHQEDPILVERQRLRTAASSRQVASSLLNEDLRPS